MMRNGMERFSDKDLAEIRAYPRDYGAQVYLDAGVEAKRRIDPSTTISLSDTRIGDLAYLDTVDILKPGQWIVRRVEFALGPQRYIGTLECDPHDPKLNCGQIDNVEKLEPTAKDLSMDWPEQRTDEQQDPERWDGMS